MGNDILANLEAWKVGQSERSVMITSDSLNSRKWEVHLSEDGNKQILQEEDATCVGLSAVIEKALRRWGK